MDKQSLNRQIAEALGYRVEKRIGKGECGWAQGFYFVLLSPNGVDIMGYDSGELESEWFTEGHAWLHVPDFDENLDAVAAELPEDAELQIMYQRTSKNYYAFIKLGRTGNYKQYGMAGVTRHEAAARALLAWAKARQS